ncbi:MAG: aminoacyl-tRNA hydrolase [Proteobacteria bacterium]|nr:aminoacyl-tRNA hydrolase [Pseudomonadota bacterium]
MEIRPGLTIPPDELAWRTSRAGGPGGQHVNTTDSRVELIFDLAGSRVLNDRVKARLRTLGGRRVNAEGKLTISSGQHRSQHRNRGVCTDRLRALILDALRPPPPPRKKTKPSRAARQRRLTSKKQRGQTKKGRGKNWGNE